MIFFNRVDMLLQIFRLSRAPNHKELKMKNRRQWLAAGVLLMASQAAFSQSQAPALPTQRVSLSASATLQVPQDELTLTLSTQREGSNAPDVQNQLKAALDAALTLARRQAQSPLMSVSTGRFGLSPRHDRNGKLIGWQGTAELVLQGRDFVRISQTAAQLQTLSVASVVFGLSAQQRQEAQAQAQSQAIEQFQNILTLEPQNAEVVFMIGSVYLDANDRSKAMDYFKKAIDIDPDHENSLNSLGYMYAEDGKNLDEAVKLIQRALEMDPENGAYLDSLGWAYYKKGMYTEAVDFLTQASVLFKDPVIYEHMGDAYFKLNQADNAEKYWKESLQLLPGQPFILEKIDTLKKTTQAAR